MHENRGRSGVQKIDDGCQAAALAQGQYPEATLALAGSGLIGCS